MALNSPEPWKTLTDGGLVIVDAHNRPIGNAWSDGIPTSECRGNARLMAAAPDMLAVLKIIQEYGNRPVNGVWDVSGMPWNEIDYAIRKATKC